ncbi:MAG: sarcinarray family MAST domain-containing protein [Methanosarcina sp.]|jgi:MAST domain-containing protein
MNKLNIFLFGFLLLIFLGNVVSASSQYGSIDVYYNDKLLPGEEIAKPVLKVGEPFKLKFNFTVYDRYYVSVKLSEPGKNDFIIIDGPTSRIEEYYGKIIEKNSTETFEWTVKPTENWAGGSLPINFGYQIDETKAGGKTLLNSKFTVAYCTISNEYYEGEIPTSEDHPVSETEPSSTSASAPAFSLITAISALVLVFFRFSRQ